MSDGTKSRRNYIAVRFTANTDSLLKTAITSDDSVSNKGSNGYAVNIVLPLSVSRTMSSRQ